MDRTIFSQPFALILLVASLFFVACNEDDEMAMNNGDFGIFTLVNDTLVTMSGDIGSSTLNDFNRLIENHPNINQINMREAPGSNDDETNLLVAKRVHDLGIATHLEDNGEIASGAVDFFLAGVRRSKGINTSIGVHSWTNGSQEATDFPVGHEEHQLYIDYYVSVGFSQQQAEDFYYFTINSAPAAEIHWMTEAEIEQYGLLTP